MRHGLRRLAASAAGLLALSLLVPASAPAQQDAGQLNAERVSDLDFRNIGPAVTGGRIHDVEALPEDPSTVYVATATGGLWRSTNAGTTWDALFQHQAVSNFGDIDIAPTDPDVIYAGTGGQQNRQSTSWGNGVYRSDDAGDTWTHLGLVETRHIAEVEVHPEDPDVAWVAAQGNLWSASEERGVYKTTDGGETWEKVLHVDTLTGANDLAVNPENPDVLYASTYQRLRRTWGFNGGGPGSGIYKSTDGGETWTELTDGIPSGDKGRIGLALARSQPSVLYATVEHGDEEQEGTYRSSDAGESWERVNSLNPRPMYYSHVFTDPNDADRVYVLSTEAYVSENGGEQFTRLPTRPTYDVGVHSDHHTMWINPADTEHFYLAGDAGLHVTKDRGDTYRRINNIPIAQFYAIGLDDRDPYHVYGGLQDNHSFMGPSESRRFMGITNGDWKQIGFGDGMYQQPTPGNHRFVYVGDQNGGLVRLDAETGDHLEISPEAMPGEEEYRFDWVTPSQVSRHDPTTFYFGGNRLFITRDRGNSWIRTEDLSKDIDRDTLTLMGRPGSDDLISENDGTASFSEATSVSESPVDPDVIWVGTDDGNVQVSRDGGRTWTEVSENAPGIPATMYVSRVTASAEGPGVAYLAFDGHRRGDFSPHLFKTEDYGQSWTSIAGDLPESAGTVNDVIEHPDNPDLLFTGTERGLYVSATDGESWTRMGASPQNAEGRRLPTTLYDDLAIHERENDLVVGTHGRSIWILDDLSALQNWTPGVASEPAHLFPLQEATYFQPWKNTSYRAQAEFFGEDPPMGATIQYHLGRQAGSARVVVRSADGDTIREMGVPGSAGVIHRVTWDLRHEPPPSEPDDEEGDPDADVVEPDTVLPALPRPTEDGGPLVSPGVYRVTLVANGREHTRTVRVEADPRMEEMISDDDFHAREAFLTDLLEMQREVFRAQQRAEEELGEDAELTDEITGLRYDIYGLAGAFTRGGVTQKTLYPPTEQHREQKARLDDRLDDLTDRLEREISAASADRGEELAGGG